MFDVDIEFYNLNLEERLFLKKTYQEFNIDAMKLPNNYRILK